jgi:hypothetical protein
MCKQRRCRLSINTKYWLRGVAFAWVFFCIYCIYNVCAKPCERLPSFYSEPINKRLSIAPHSQAQRPFHSDMSFRRVPFVNTATQFIFFVLQGSMAGMWCCPVQRVSHRLVFVARSLLRVAGIESEGVHLWYWTERSAFDPWTGLAGLGAVPFVVLQVGKRGLRLGDRGLRAVGIHLG